MNNFISDFSKETNEFDNTYEDQIFLRKLTYHETPAIDHQNSFMPIFFNSDLSDSANKCNSYNQKQIFGYNWGLYNNFESIEANYDEKLRSVDETEFPKLEVVNKSKTPPSRTSSVTDLTRSLQNQDNLVQNYDMNFDNKSWSGVISSEYESDFQIQDLNEVVDQILSANHVEYFKSQGIDLDDETLHNLSINKRKRKTRDQQEILKKHYITNSNWNKEFMHSLAKELKMSFSSIYKWHWDQKHKTEEETDDSHKLPQNCTYISSIKSRDAK